MAPTQVGQHHPAEVELHQTLHRHEEAVAVVEEAGAALACGLALFRLVSARRGDGIDEAGVVQQEEQLGGHCQRVQQQVAEHQRDQTRLAAVDGADEQRAEQHQHALDHHQRHQRRLLGRQHVLGRQVLQQLGRLSGLRQLRVLDQDGQLEHVDGGEQQTGHLRRSAGSQVSRGQRSHTGHSLRSAGSLQRRTLLVRWCARL